MMKTFYTTLSVSIALIVGGFFTPPMGVIDGSILSAVGLLLMFAVLAQVPAMLQAVKEGKHIRLSKGDFTAEVGQTPHIAPLFALPLLLALTACGTSKPLQQVHTQAMHDTLFTHQLHYDSIWVSSNITTDRTHDTVTIHSTHTEYRFRLIHDTIRLSNHRAQVDSIPYVVPRVQTLNLPPLQSRWLLHFLAAAVLVVVWVLRCRK